MRGVIRAPRALWGAGAAPLSKAHQEHFAAVVAAAAWARSAWATACDMVRPIPRVVALLWRFDIWFDKRLWVGDDRAVAHATADVLAAFAAAAPASSDQRSRAAHLAAAVPPSDGRHPPSAIYDVERAIARKASEYLETDAQRQFGTRSGILSMLSGSIVVLLAMLFVKVNDVFSELTARARARR